MNAPAFDNGWNGRSATCWQLVNTAQRGSNHATRIPSRMPDWAPAWWAPAWWAPMVGASSCKLMPPASRTATAPGRCCALRARADRSCSTSMPPAATRGRARPRPARSGSRSCTSPKARLASRFTRSAGRGTHGSVEALPALINRTRCSAKNFEQPPPQPKPSPTPRPPSCRHDEWPVREASRAQPFRF